VVGRKYIIYMQSRCEYFETEEWKNRKLNVIRSRLTVAELRNWFEDDSRFDEYPNSKTVKNTDIRNELKITDDELISAWESREKVERHISENCPHDAIRDGLCIFHLPIEKKDDTQVGEELLDNLRNGETDFVGSKFGRLSINREVLRFDSNDPIDLRYSQFHSLDLSKSVINQDIYFNYSNISNELKMVESRVEGKFYLSHAIVGSVEARESKYLSKFVATYAIFEEPVVFGDCSFSAKFLLQNTVYEDIFDMTNSVIDGQASFINSEFNKNSILLETSFEDSVDFSDATFKTFLTMEGAYIRDAQFNKTRSLSEPINLRYSDIHAGRIQQAEDKTLYDLTSSKLGNVKLESLDTEDNMFDYLGICLTEFDNFDFSEQKKEIADNWDIHGYGVEEADSICNAPEEIEKTYLKAKNGAKEMGDSKAVSEFFLNELRYRRKFYHSKINEGLSFFARWASNWSYCLTCGYGERPSRTIISSFFIILAFSVGYTVTDIGLEGVDDETFFSYLTFSFQAFVSLVLGAAPTVESNIFKIAIGIEAFAGAFFIALFVFSLTRSLHK